MRTLRRIDEELRSPRDGSLFRLGIVRVPYADKDTAQGCLVSPREMGSRYQTKRHRRNQDLSQDRQSIQNKRTARPALFEGDRNEHESESMFLVQPSDAWGSSKANKRNRMSYTTTEREIIAENIRQFLKENKKEIFEEHHFGGDPILVKRLVPMTQYDKDNLENVARDVDGRILHP